MYEALCQLIQVLQQQYSNNFLFGETFRRKLMLCFFHSFELYLIMLFDITRNQISTTIYWFQKLIDWK
jgi:hypothetical protein